jgi:hypothetical protein
MGNPRYAICFAPEQGSALEALDRTWFGRDAAKLKSLVPGIKDDRFEVLTRGPRNYGMHGTLKPSFELNPHTTENGLLTVAGLIAKSLSPFEVPPLELGEIGNIVSLVLEVSSEPLEDLQAACVRAFDGFRRPLTAGEEETYKRNRLTVHQDKMLEHWGYPYVMEEFDFHISLTDPVTDEHERSAIKKVLEKLATPVLHKPFVMRELAIFRQRDGAPMEIILRAPFGRAA